MKKQLLNLSACAVLLAIAASTFALPLVPPVRDIEIPYAGQVGDITIDGTADAAYSADQSTDVFNPTGWTNAADYTFSFKVAWNPMYLYVIGTVADDFDNSLTYTTDANPWEYDNCEIFLSLDTTDSETATSSGYGGDTNCVQLRINRGIDSIQTPGRATQEEYVHHWENTATGWMFETAVPWTSVLGDGQVKEDMLEYIDAISGFDMSGADSDELGAGHRDCQTAWDNDDPSDPADRTEDNAWTNRMVFGIMTLGGDATDFIFPSSVEPTVDNNISVYPNPAVNSINLDIDGLQTVEIFSITGVQVMVVETTGIVDISNLNSGLYVARVGNSSVRFVKE